MVKEELEQMLEDEDEEYMLGLIEDYFADRAFLTGDEEAGFYKLMKDDDGSVYLVYFKENE